MTGATSAALAGLTRTAPAPMADSRCHSRGPPAAVRTMIGVRAELSTERRRSASVAPSTSARWGSAAPPGGGGRDDRRPAGGALHRAKEKRQLRAVHLRHLEVDEHDGVGVLLEG